MWGAWPDCKRGVSGRSSEGRRDEGKHSCLQSLLGFIEAYSCSFWCPEHLRKIEEREGYSKEEAVSRGPADGMAETPDAFRWTEKNLTGQQSWHFSPLWPSGSLSLASSPRASESEKIQSSNQKESRDNGRELH